jgi:hypothetical protein
MGSAVSGGIDRPTLEKQWANHEARLKLNKDDKALWDSSRYTVRPYVYYNKVLIAWTVVKGQPQIKEIFKVIGLDVSFQDGVWLRMHAEIAGCDVMLSHAPRRLLPNLEVLAWMPYFNEVRFASADWDDLNAKKNLRLHACFKMRSRGDEPVTGLIREQHDFLSELHVFRELWPQYAVTRF